MTTKTVTNRARLTAVVCAAIWQLQMFTAATVAVADEWRYGAALGGAALKYAADFKHFDYVNPNAPKGGELQLAATGTFDTLNVLVPRGNPAVGLGLIYQQLMESSLDEPSSQYGLIAQSVAYPEDFSSVTFRLNPAAKWHDGKPITVQDVLFSYEEAVKLSPSRKHYYRNVADVSVVGDREIKFTFDVVGNRELPYILGQLIVFPKHWWQGRNSDGERRDITKPTLEPPLGSGAYRVAAVSPGRSVTFERVPDAWANNHPTQVGSNNIGRITYLYYRNAIAQLEAFKSGNVQWRRENSAKRWATAYDFPAVREGKVVLETFPQRGVGVMQAWALNLRDARFQDARVRRAFNLAFNFEDFNRASFFDQYTRIDSYFYGIDMASSGLPSAEELAILEPLRGTIPDEVFEQPYRNPSHPNRRATRENLRLASRLLSEAGWRVRNGVRTNAAGETLELEVIVNSDIWIPHVLRYAKQLQPLGIVLKPRLLDSSQYIARVRERDYDMMVALWAQSLSPGNEQRNYWGSEAADQAGSSNYTGIADPAIDQLIERVIAASDYDDLTVATRALDRVLLANHFVIPMWASQTYRTARWNLFAHPETMPYYGIGFPTVWWWIDEQW